MQGTDQPLGYQFALAMNEGGAERVRSVAKKTASEPLAESFLRVHAPGEQFPAFLHSALCSMSLPVQEPKNPYEPIIRVNGRQGMVINPRPVMRVVDGKHVVKSLGVPFGTYPRILLIYIMTEAVRRQSREVYLGKNLSEWMRRLGFKSMSAGKTGNSTRLLEQFDRTLACEFQWRWDENIETEAAFAVKDLRVADEYCGIGRGEDFERVLKLSEPFYSELNDHHTVPLNERAIAELKSNATALDLYTFLAHRLFRIDGPDVRLSWEQLAIHMGNESGGRSFRQRIREVLGKVLSVYPAADVDFSGHTIVLRQSKAANEGTLVGRHLRLVGPPQPRSKSVETEKADVTASSRAPTQVTAPAKEAREAVSSALSLTSQELVFFPSGSLCFGNKGQPYYRIGREYGHPYDVDKIADSFRSGYKDINKPKRESDWINIFKGYCRSYVSRRKAED